MLVTLGHSLDLKVPNNERNAVRGARRGIEKKVKINSKNDLAQLFKSPPNFLSQDLQVVFPPRFPSSITLRAPSVTLLAFRSLLAFQIESKGDEAGTNTKLSTVAAPGERPATAMPYVVRVLFPFSATTKRVGFLRFSLDRWAWLALVRFL